MNEKRVPVRIQVWHDDVRLDFRVWLDELTVTNEVPALDAPATWWRSRSPLVAFKRLRHDVKVTAHTDDDPWKFYRGKPVVVS